MSLLSKVEVAGCERLWVLHEDVRVGAIPIALMSLTHSSRRMPEILTPLMFITGHKGLSVFMAENPPVEGTQIIHHLKMEKVRQEL